MATDTTASATLETTGATPTELNTEGATPEVEVKVKSPQTLAASLEALADAEAARKSAESKMREASKQAAEVNRKLKDLEDAQKKRDDADKTELQKAQDDLAAARDALTQSQAVAKRHTILADVRRISGKMEIALNDNAISKLYDAGDFNALEADGDGKYPQLEEFVKELIKSNPWVIDNHTKAPDIHSQSRGSKSMNQFDAVRNEAIAKRDAQVAAPSWREQYGNGRRN